MFLVTAVVAGDDPFAKAETKEQLTKFGLVEYAWLTRPSGDQAAPLIVFLHDFKETHDSAAPVIKALMDYIAADTSGEPVVPYTLTFDLRGHGKSLKLGRQFKTFETMATLQWIEVPEELAEMTMSVARDTAYHIDTTRIILVGSIFGANAAALMTQFIPEAAKVIMLSPWENNRGLEIPETLSNYRGEGIIMNSKRSLRLNDQAKKMVEGNKQGTLILKDFPKRGAGWGLLVSNPEAMHDLVEMLTR